MKEIIQREHGKSMISYCLWSDHTASAPQDNLGYGHVLADSWSGSCLFDFAVWHVLHCRVKVQVLWFTSFILYDQLLQDDTCHDLPQYHLVPKLNRSKDNSKASFTTPLKLSWNHFLWLLDTLMWDLLLPTGHAIVFTKLPMPLVAWQFFHVQCIQSIYTCILGNPLASPYCDKRDDGLLTTSYLLALSLSNDESHHHLQIITIFSQRWVVEELIYEPHHLCGQNVEQFVDERSPQQLDLFVLSFMH